MLAEKVLSQMNSSVEPFVPGQAAAFYSPGSVIQTHLGVWYVHRDGQWKLMSAEEVSAHLQAQENK